MSCPPIGTHLRAAVLPHVDLAAAAAEELVLAFGVGGHRNLRRRAQRQPGSSYANSATVDTLVTSATAPGHAVGLGDGSVVRRSSAGPELREIIFGWP